MPCHHKFIDYLNLDRIDFQPTDLVIGTFNPGWGNLNNQADWFYGRRRNNYFWDALPRLYENVNLRHQPSFTWKQFCSRNSIAITDLLRSINDADEQNPAHRRALSKYEDSKIARSFENFTPVDVVGILQKHRSIQHVYLTRQTGIPLWDDFWLTITNYCDQNDISHQTLLTPSGHARFQMQRGSGILLRDFIYNNWEPFWHQMNG